MLQSDEELERRKEGIVMKRRELIYPRAPEGPRGLYSTSTHILSSSPPMLQSQEEIEQRSGESATKKVMGLPKGTGGVRSD